MQIFECEQGSDEWVQARLGIPTASQFATVLASGKGGGESVTRKAYLYKLAGEIITGEPMDNYTNAYMDRGHEQEPEARSLYSFITDETVTPIGFIREGGAGCSPDALVGDDGVLEVKTCLPHIMVGYVLKGQFPPEHKAQTQGALWITGRKWVDIAIYHPKMPLFVRRAERDETYIEILAAEIARFNRELAEIVERVQGRSTPIREALERSLA